jgi:2-polyprenyl-3-methyl-5-hydroxy-6-metoxy-1,4-benzoquinol methylase
MSCTFAQLPFYWRLKPPGATSPVPEFLPFEYGFDESVQLIIQKRDPATLGHLATIYREDANIGYLQDANDIAKPYGTDFTRFIDDALGRWGGKVRRILELGCGGCTILSQLAARGYEVTGIDPGPLAVREGERRGLRVIHDFFPTPAFRSEVDFIFHNDVLEHVDDPVGFLLAQRRQLSPGGMIITAVPDCTDGVLSGEISMTMHQHLNYYDLDSLRRVFEAAGLQVLAAERAAYGGSLYCCAVNDPSTAPAASGHGDLKHRTFVAKAAANTEAVTRRMEQAFRDGGRVGFYVPLRTLPYLSVLGRWSGFRFFDDTSHWYGRCFDGVPVPVENFEDLRRNPVDTLFIMSLTFGRKIGERVSGLGRSGMKVIQLSDLVSLDGQGRPR